MQDKPKKVKSPDNEMIRLQIEDWKSKFSENNNRGKEMIDFIACGKQWSQGVTSKRRVSGKESLTLNICKKELNKLLSQNAEIEFAINVHPATIDSQQNVEESNTFGILMNDIILDNKITTAITHTFNKSASFGYAFGEINFKRKSADDLSLYPVYICHKDPRRGFWDINAYSSTKIDGRYCGIVRKMSMAELRRKGYTKNQLSTCNVTDRDNDVVDYWFREECETEYYLLKSGIQKRKELLTYDDKNNLMDKQRLSILRKCGEINGELELVMWGTYDKIYFKRVCNWIDLECPKQFPTDDLPLLYHNAFTEWTPEMPCYTIPYGYELKGAQKLLNFINSQIATQAKNSSADKWFFNTSHVSTPQQLENAREINKTEGGMVFGGDVSTIRRERPAEVSMSLIQMSQSIKQIVDEISGAMIDTQNAQQTVISGKALNKITDNMKLLNDKALAEHIIFVNDLSRLMCQIIPNIITEERVLVVKKKDGSSQAIVVNQELGTGEIRNNIKDIRDRFIFDLTAGSNEEMQREVTSRVLTNVYQLDPQLLKRTADIYFRNSGCKDAGELARRVSVDIDPALIKWSQGEMSDQEFMMAQQKQQQQAELEKQKSLQNDPEYQGAVAAAAAEDKKADALQKDADTKRIKTLGDIINDENKNDISFAKVLLDADQGEAAHAIDVIKSSMDVNDQMIDRMREVIGDNDMPLQGQSEPGAPNAQGGENPTPVTQNQMQGGEPNAGPPNQ